MANWYAIRARGTGAEVAIYDEIGAYGSPRRASSRNWARCPRARPSICG